MRGKAYRRLFSARRRPLLVLLLVVVVLVVWRVTVVVAPRWVGVEVVVLLLVCIVVSVAVIAVRDRRPAPSEDPPKTIRTPPGSWAADDTIKARMVNAAERQPGGEWDWVDDPQFLRRLEVAQHRRGQRTGRSPR